MARHATGSECSVGVKGQDTESTSTKTIRLDAGKTQAWAAMLFTACGMPADDATQLAFGVVQPSVRGVDSHGLIRIPQYLENLSQGRVNPNPKMSFITEFGGIAVLNADNGSGHVASARAMRRAIELARAFGIASISVRDSSHFGAAATWAALAADEDCIGMVWTNGPPVMPPTGGKEARLSNNPIAVAVPANQHPSVILDIAMSIAAGGKLRLAMMEGRSIPSDWALTKEGEPTTDPREATAGLLLPIGGHKGYGLAFIGDVLSGVLSGSLFGPDVRSQGVAAIGQKVDTRGGSKLGVGHFCMVIDVSKFMPVQEFKSRMDALIDQMHSSPPMPGFDRVWVPGEIENETAIERRATGIPIPVAVFTAIEKAAARVGQTVPTDLRL